MKIIIRCRLGSMLLCALVLSVLPITSSADESYSPYAGQSYPNQVYWGDTHVHTSYSSHDANIGGGNRVSPEIAYQFARGEVVEAWNGMPVKLSRPLDFLVVADHAGGLGIISALQAGDPTFPTTEAGNRLRKAYEFFVASSESQRANASLRAALKGRLPPAYRNTLWRRVVANAEKYNDPGKFTAFAGYEWTAGGFANLHRVVIYRDGPDKTSQTIPFSILDSHQPEDLWNYLQNYQDASGGEVLAIPHNSNLSGGQMFARHKFGGFKPGKSGGEPLTADWANLRSRFEPLMEITQFKGDSETHPVLSPTDEFADFETWNGWRGALEQKGSGPSSDAYIARKQAEYARPALKAGLDIQAELGVNPFKFGIIGGTDTHTSLSTADNDNFWGKFSQDGPSADRPSTRWVPSWETPLKWEMGAAGYAGVWARENTRESLFAAMKRKEVYGSTGPRISLRFFGGWNYAENDALRPDLARVGYAGGVPMGGDLSHAPEGKSPNFLIRSVKDPDGANLDRVQVIKGWRDGDGILHEKIYNVALADGRKEDANGRVEPVGSTVDVADASYANSIGDPELAVVWVDPDFDPEELAFYYVRVIEIPTPRWTAYDAKFYGLKDLSPEIPMVTQERAYSSPIWYTP
jgi:hypothetical protein